MANQMKLELQQFPGFPVMISSRGSERPSHVETTRHCDDHCNVGLVSVEPSLGRLTASR